MTVRSTILALGLLGGLTAIAAPAEAQRFDHRHPHHFHPHHHPYHSHRGFHDNGHRDHGRDHRDHGHRR